MMDGQAEFLSAKEFASLIGVHYNTVIRSIKRGRLSAFRVGEGKRACYRISRSEINRIAFQDLEKMVNEIIERNGR